MKTLPSLAKPALPAESAATLHKALSSLADEEQHEDFLGMVPGSHQELYADFFGTLSKSLQAHMYINFKLQNGELCRLVSGSGSKWKPVTRRERGLLVADFEKVTYYASDIAWLLTYGIWPKYSTTTILGNDRFTPDNLIACAPKKARFMPYDFSGGEFGKSGFGARGLKTTYKTNEECKAAWEAHTIAKYQAQMPAVLAEQCAVLEFMEVKGVSLPDVFAKAAITDPNLMPERPRAIPGRIWYFYVHEWLCLPLPCHELDDIRNRAKLYKQGFEYFYHHEGKIYALRDAPTFQGSIPQ
jgi:hypothetical protein